MRALRIGEVATPGLAVALLLGWDLTAAVVLAGVTYVTSSGITAKVLADLDWIGNRETPVVLSLLVLEDLTMALYPPIVTALLAGVGLLGGSITVAVALTMVGGVLLVALRFGRAVEAFVTSPSEEVLLLKVLGLTLLVAGLAQRLQVSAAVGSFLVGITLSGPLAHTARELLSPLRDLFAAVFFVFFGLQTDPGALPPVAAAAIGLALVGAASKLATGWLAAGRAGIGTAGRLRAGTALVPRGEFSIVIAALAVAAGLGAPTRTARGRLRADLAVLGPLVARGAEPLARLTNDDQPPHDAAQDLTKMVSSSEVTDTNERHDTPPGA